ncbi:MAG: carbohydrate binding family 9 domain-containing protein [Candidatus Eisenbacteria bacterium]|uniref:Carbohydrate binding family 9 domain-containing protein n=1 Tax=Eiseniibacteriota bacterium TaxID=2212470 RepID=A0A948WE64_UNCEI|nr:carbohydrate binding family 9 domain-containing protein [Candidatus Eisenbacteria bacterium]MBU2692483.1 carbohydrate binding family 9 domain-containing protein [Candidatus Eisenbacteria bacterium]
MKSSPIIALSVLGLILIAFSISPGLALDGFDPQRTGPGYPEAANGRMNEPPSLTAHKISHGSIQIDGHLDEVDWMNAPAATGFTQFEPERRGEPCEETVFKVIYDEDAIYFGVACYRLKGEPIISCLSRRDQIASSDRIRIYISPYHDMVTGYHFRINPHGVKEDYYNYGDLYHDISWDAVWDADTSIDEEGWYAELRIPFSSIRYRAAESMTWGFNVFQYIHSQAQRTAWSNWDRDQNGFMSRSGTITGIKGIRSPRQLEITPYVASSTTDPSDVSAHGFYNEDWHHFSNFGTDVKYGVTSDLTLNATFQPDFGQVEADPSVLNLSPYETYYSEKRPFFIEGAQFFWHPDFTVFYSRRIGTGSENSRIRYAGKMTGKTAGDISTAILVAATDETMDGQAHNTFKNGDQKAFYAIGRFGKQFHNDMHSINIMQTGVIRDKGSYEYSTRNGYTTGGDFELNFRDRMYQITGSFVGSIVDRLGHPEDSSDNPDPDYGTGSRFEVEKTSGDWRWALTTRHQSDKLDINDLGYISDPNHYAVQAWVTRVFNADDGERFLKDGNVHARFYQNWIYADRRFPDPADPSKTIWSYDRGHNLNTLWHIEGSLETRDFWGAWINLDYHPDCTEIYTTRWTPDRTQRGPLMTAPANYNASIGFWSDSRKTYGFDGSIETGADVEGSRRLELDGSVYWVQNSRIRHNLSLEYERAFNDAQWVGNFENAGGGIGGVSYVFGELEQRTWDLTLRSRFLFSRDASLELYLQPFLTVGNYSKARELVQPDSYDLEAYDYDVSAHDFAYGAVNLNLVYRWEYRPGSSFYLVWTHSREDYDARAFHGDPGEFENNFSTRPIFDNEAENRFLAKISYWFSI